MERAEKREEIQEIVSNSIALACIAARAEKRLEIGRRLEGWLAKIAY